MDQESALRQFARDLVHIEVNTILTDRINGRKMPSIPHALLDIACAYVDRMADDGVDLAKWWAIDLASGNEEKALEQASIEWEPQAAPRPASPENGWLTFARLRWAARRALETPAFQQRLPAERRTMYNRICRHSDQLKEILRPIEGKEPWQGWIGATRGAVVRKSLKRQPPQLDLHRIGQIRKIWEVGTDDIVCQTVLQLDGDVTTRLRRDLCLEPEADAREAGKLSETDLRKVMHVHGTGVELSVRYWRALFETVAGLLGDGLSVLFGRKGGA